MRRSRVQPHRKLRSRVPGVEIHRLRTVADPRGDLAAAEFLREVPFSPKRFFLVHDVPTSSQRGEHAHKTCRQFLVCIGGSLRVRVDNGRRRQTISLKPFHAGLYVPPAIWCRLSAFTRDAILLVFASHHYDPADYLRDRADYEAWMRSRKR